MTEVVLEVTGYPAPQGSKKAWVNKATGRAQMTESSAGKIQLWRQDVKGAANGYVGSREGTGDPFATLSGALEVRVCFRFPRPKSHYRTGKHSHLLRENAPLFPITRATGDNDKLCRATFDALVVAGLFADDAQVAGMTSWKTYADAGLPGATITIRTLDHDEAT